MVEEKVNVFKQDGPLLARYLGFETTGHLWGFVWSDLVKTILAAYQRHRKADVHPFNLHCFGKSLLRLQRRYVLVSPSKGAPIHSDSFA